MTASEISQLSIEQKIQLMEQLWQDLRDRFDQADLPEAVRQLLDHRRQRVQSGVAQLRDWDEVKNTLDRR